MSRQAGEEVHERLLALLVERLPGLTLQGAAEAVRAAKTDHRGALRTAEGHLSLHADMLVPAWAALPATHQS